MPRRRRRSPPPYGDVLAAIAADRLDANVSVKLTGLGLKLDLDLCRSLLEGLVRDAARPRLLRADRHGGRELRRRHAGPLPRASRGGPRERRDRPAGVPEADAYRYRGVARPAAQCPDLQGDLRRAGLDRVPGLRGRAALLRRVPGGAARGRLPGRDRDARRASARGVACPRCVAAARGTTSSRCCWVCASAGQASSSRRAIRLRVYVPYGQQWYEYSLRRLQENPRMAGVIAKATIGRAVGKTGRARPTPAVPPQASCDLPLGRDVAAALGLPGGPAGGPLQGCRELACLGHASSAGEQMPEVARGIVSSTASQLRRGERSRRRRSASGRAPCLRPAS